MTTVAAGNAGTLAVCCAIALTTVTRPQLHPDFSGVWAFEQPPVAEATRAGFLRTWTGDPVTITQTSVTIMIAYLSGSRAHAPVTLVYSLDGSQRRNVDRNSGPGISTERVTRAVWEGTSLVLTTTALRVTNSESDPVVITEVLSLQSLTTMSIAITEGAARRLASLLAEQYAVEYLLNGSGDQFRIGVARPNVSVAAPGWVLQ
jgi:hypothetical protein